MRAAIYARYSSDNQREASIEDQVRICRAHIEQAGWEVAGVYSDHAISGATTLRPGYQKLLEDARAGRFDVIVAESLDRLSRDQEDIAGLYKQLTFAGVTLSTLAEGEISELHVGLKGTMNALYLKDLAQKTRRGLKGRVRQGRSGGGLCYGYDVVEKADDRGRRVINQDEAAVIRRIFRDYADGRSPKAIALQLNRERVPGPRAEAWGPSTINGNAKRGTGILNNELYVGKLVWNRLRYLKDPATGKRISRPNPPEQWIIQDVPELRIIDEALWQRVKARQETMETRRGATRGEPGFWDRRRPRYLFSGLMKCGVCGGGYSKISQNLFGCSTARNKGTCGNRHNIRRDVLEGTVLNGLRHHLMDPDLFKEFADEFYREVNRLRMAETAKIEKARAELATLDRRVRKIVDTIAEGAPAKALTDELVRLEGRQEELARLIETAGDPPPLVHPSLAEVYRRKVEDLHVALEDEGTGAEAAEIVRGLVDEIVLTPEEDMLRIDLRGDIATILSLTLNSKNPAAGGRGIEQIKLVAGARNHRNLPVEILALFSMGLAQRFNAPA